MGIAFQLDAFQNDAFQTTNFPDTSHVDWMMHSITFPFNHYLDSWLTIL